MIRKCLKVILRDFTLNPWRLSLIRTSHLSRGRMLSSPMTKCTLPCHARGTARIRARIVLKFIVVQWRYHIFICPFCSCHMEKHSNASYLLLSSSPPPFLPTLQNMKKYTKKGKIQSLTTGKNNTESKPPKKVCTCFLLEKSVNSAHLTTLYLKNTISFFCNIDIIH